MSQVIDFERVLSRMGSGLFSTAHAMMESSSSQNRGLSVFPQMPNDFGLRTLLAINLQNPLQTFYHLHLSLALESAVPLYQGGFVMFPLV